MSQKERQKYHLLQMVLESKTTLKKASRLMGASSQHARRLKKNLATEGARALSRELEERFIQWIEALT